MGCALPEVGLVPRNAWARRVRECAPAPYGVADPADAPALDPDALDELADEIRVLAAHLHAGTRELLGLIARFDAAGGWKPGGHRGCENWLSLNTGVALRVAREYVRVARALEDLPETGASMGRGALSLCQVRALTRVATPDTETDLLELAEGASTAVLERECRAWKTLGRKDEAERERALHDSRRLALYPNGDGMYRLDALLMPEEAATFGKALDRARFALYRNRGEAEWSDDPAEISRHRADAAGLMAEWALAYRSNSGKDDDSDDDRDDPISGTRAERFQVMLHVEPATLAAEGEPGRSELEDGTRLAAETARRLACDCGLVRVERGPGGEVLNIGRKSRSLPSALRRALEVRDRGCRFPGCGLRFTDGHHLVHWADGGETSLRNTMLLCRVHHRLVHEGRWRVEWWGRDRHPVFIDPRGQAHGSLRPPRPSLPDAVEALVRRNRARGADPDADTAPARWHRQRDIPDEVLFRALEATAPG
ncbi:MAG TPA: DUF222 domain-containing protein [Gemmatimonadota bacterium]|nr:DUF222 domain-containing protein [Gemmatimonadota bacterium]